MILAHFPVWRRRFKRIMAWHIMVDGRYAVARANISTLAGHNIGEAPPGSH